MKIWTDAMVQAAQILSRAGYTSREAADAMGIKRTALLGRASRMNEFKFEHPRGKANLRLNIAAHEAAVASAKKMITGIDTSELPKPRPKMKPPKNREMVPIRENKRPTQPVVRRSQALVETPLSKEEVKEVLEDEGVTSKSVAFSEMKNNHCKWPVGRDEFGETMVCGEERSGKSSYCEAHATTSKSQRQPKPINPTVVYLWDQSTRAVVVTRKMGSSLPRRS
jgi:hypothetical protein